MQPYPGGHDGEPPEVGYTNVLLLVEPAADRSSRSSRRRKKAGIDRQVLILMDDVILTGKATDQLAHLCMRAALQYLGDDGGGQLYLYK